MTRARKEGRERTAGSSRAALNAMTKKELVELLSAREAVDPSMLREGPVRRKRELPGREFEDLEALGTVVDSTVRLLEQQTKVRRVKVAAKLVGTKRAEIAKVRLTEAEESVIQDIRVSPQTGKVVAVKFVDPTRVKKTLMDVLADLYRSRVRELGLGEVDYDADAERDEEGRIVERETYIPAVPRAQVKERR